MVSEDGQDQRTPDGESLMPESLCQAFLARARAMVVRKGQEIVARGADASDVFLILSGKVQVTLPSGNGRDVILRDMGPRRLFGEMAAIDEQPRSASVLVLDDGELARMGGRAFAAFLADVPGAGLWLSRQLAARIRNLTDRVFELSTMPVAARVQAELLRLAAALPADGGGRVRIAPMPTHAQIAARIGSHREAVSRELGILAREGLLVQSGRALDILSLDRLRSLHDRFSR